MLSSAVIDTHPLEKIAPQSNHPHFHHLCEIVKNVGLEGLYKKLDELEIPKDFQLVTSDLLHLALLDEHGKSTFKEMTFAEIQQILEAVTAEKTPKQSFLAGFSFSASPEKHIEIREKNGEGMAFVTNRPFQSWEGTVKNVPAITFMPKTIEGLQNLVRWAQKENKRIRLSGYRHSSSSIYSQDNEILVSMLDLKTATSLPASHPPMNPESNLQGIELVGAPYEKDGKRKMQCKFGAATCNYHFYEWVHDPERGNREWALPFNVIMTEITFGGSNAPICHGAGRTSTTLSDLVTEIEFINAKGELQKITDKEQLRAAAGCFGLLGIVVSITLELDEMTYANFKTVERKSLAQAIPPPPNFKVSENMTQQLNNHNVSAFSNAQQMQAAFRDFVNRCENHYYAEWFWFPLQDQCWVNSWNNDGDKKDAVRFPGTAKTEVERIESYIAHVANDIIGDKIPIIRKIQTKILSTLAMMVLPDKRDVVCTLEDATHFQQGIQNIRTKMMEIEIPIPDLENGNADWSICQKAWWSVVSNIYKDENLHYLPMRTTLEMRITGGSNILLAPQSGNKRTCSIEVLTPINVNHKRWRKFLQETLDGWAALKDRNGKFLNIRPHWAKRFDGLNITRDISWKNEWDVEQYLALGKYINVKKGKISVPFGEYLKYVAYKEQFKQFKAQLKTICAAGGYDLNDIQQRFSNLLFDEYIFKDNTPKLEERLPEIFSVTHTTLFKPRVAPDLSVLATYKLLEQHYKILKHPVGCNILHKGSSRAKGKLLERLLREIKHQEPYQAIATILNSLKRLDHGRGVVTKVFKRETTTKKLLIDLMTEISRLNPPAQSPSLTLNRT